MKTIMNPASLNNHNDEPYLIKDGNVDRPGCLAEWIILMLGQLPQGSLETADGWKAVEVMRACNVAKKNKTEIILEDDHYEWVKKILFDDETGKKLHEKLKGSYALNMFGLVAMEVKRGLDVLYKYPD